jgi:L-iditol 2-dehydrogenase
MKATRTMQALVKYGRGSGNMEIREVPVPGIKPWDVLVEVAACGICGTDLKIREDHFVYDPPVIMGHEFSGIIREMGAGVRGWKPGDRVVAEQHFLSCEACSFCLTGKRQFCPEKRSPGYYSQGAFARYIGVEASLLHRVPDTVSLEEAALVEPMGIAAYGILGKARVNPGEFVVILGSGPIALMALQLVRSCGAGQVVMTGLDEDEKVRFTKAREFGATLTLNSQKDDAVLEVLRLTAGRGADLVIDLSGAAPAILSGFRMLRKDGRFCAIGLPSKGIELPWPELVLKAQTLFFSYSSDYQSWEACLALLEQKKFNTSGFCDHIYPLEAWEAAFETAQRGEALKVILKP